MRMRYKLKRDLFLLLFASIAEVAGLYVCFKFVRWKPFLTFGSFTLIILVGLVAKVRVEGIRLALLAFTSTTFALLVLEGGLVAFAPARKSGLKTLNTGKTYVDGELGYGPVPNQTFRMKRWMGDLVSYDVSIRINEHGLRHTPGLRRPHGPHAVFFGGSCVFGEGVEDDETLPARFCASAEGRYQCHNLGWRGRGPQQMLRYLESKELLAARTSDVYPELGVYLAIYGHKSRVAGQYPAISWNATGPRYVLRDGKPIYAGRFLSLPMSRAISILMRSQVGDRLLSLTFDTITSPRGWDLLRAVIVESRDRFLASGGKRFLVVSVDHDLELAGVHRAYGQLQEALVSQGIELVRTSEIYRDYPEGLDKYALPVDLHPSPLAHERVARALVEWLKARPRP